MTDDYRVHLDTFEGPLDLLLYLIRRAEVEITDIPIARIADQYLAYLEGIESIDIERAGEFLVLAATLMEIKSRLLAPVPAGGEDGAEAGEGKGGGDPRAELVQQLLEYKRYRDAADRLDRRRVEWSHRFPAAPASVSPPQGSDAADGTAAPDTVEAGADLELEEVDVLDLAAAFARILDTVDFDRLDQHRVVMDETPVELHAADLLDRLAELARAEPAGSAGGGEGGVEFAAIFAGRTRSEMIGLFLAMLELVRQRKVVVRQDAVNARIVVGLAPSLPDEPGAS